MLRKYFYLFIIQFVVVASFAQQQNISVESIRTNLSWLASDSLKGRFPGTAEDAITASYIKNEFEKAGLSFFDNNAFQSFEVVTSVLPGNNNSLLIDGISGTYNSDYSVFGFSANASSESDVVFAGFGMIIDTDSLKWNDYENIDVSGKWVLVLKGDPEPENNDSKFIPFADTRAKAMYAKDKGAAGILFIGGKMNNPKDEIAPLLFERSVISSGIAAIDLKAAWAAKLLFPVTPALDSIESLMMKGIKPDVFKIGCKVNAVTELIQQKVTTHNIVGYIEGNDAILKNEYIIIGAHYDHLGFGGEGSGSRMPDTVAVHHGADDNASGVSGIIGLSAQIAKNKIGFKRSLIVVAFSAEEMGLLGSRYFVKNLPVPKVNIIAMLNFDMIGRLNEKKSISVGGTGTAVEWEPMLNDLTAESGLTMAFSPEGFGASDHASFYAEDIPVLFFSTGAHADYHTPMDVWEKINFEGLKMVLDLGDAMLVKLLNSSNRLTFQEAGPKERTTGRRGFKVTLGIMPDFTSTETDGLGVGGVTKGAPAERAGMLKGDKIVGLNGMPVGTIYDYMNRLKQLKPGQRVNVDIVRNGAKIVLIVDL
ncbi:MAG: M28 family peptidase [Bacteroidales bacterium]|nr:M28 family peptidase [Bacteroidales bacterium]